jgi:hypothetical protein
VIVRGTIVNGGWTAEADGTLLVRIDVERLSYEDVRDHISPSGLRGRTAVLVLGDPTAANAALTQISQAEAANSDSDDGESVDAETTSQTVGGD